jgi:hypothetical protein
MAERILLMGAPGTGKSLQLIKVCEFVVPTKMYVVDLEDKMAMTMNGLGEMPENMHLSIAFDWDEFVVATENIIKIVKPGEWIAIDRMDLAWPFVQRWYANEVFNESLSDQMIQKAKMGKNKNAMLAARFEGGGWQRINEEYESRILKIFYKSRANLLLTTGVKAAGEAKQDTFGNLDVLPRGQKEIGHQPHSVFWLHQKKTGRNLTWHITTAKDLPGRDRFDEEELFDFPSQYLCNYYEK